MFVFSNVYERMVKDAADGARLICGTAVINRLCWGDDGKRAQGDGRKHYSKSK